jgi:hypothetical protein
MRLKKPSPEIVARFADALPHSALVFARIAKKTGLKPEDL